MLKVLRQGVLCRILPRLCELQRTVHIALGGAVAVEAMWRALNRIATKYRPNLGAGKAGQQGFIRLYKRSKRRARERGHPFPETFKGLDEEEEEDVEGSVRSDMVPVIY